MLSILIPTYNYSIFHLVQGVHKQCSNFAIAFEIRCLDDHSENLFQLENQKIKNLSHCFYAENLTNLGRTKTRQLLAEQASFDWLLFLDADVLPASETFIEKYVKLLSESIEVVFGGYQYENKLPESSKILRYRFGKEREEKSVEIRKLSPYQYTFSGNMLIRKELFLKLNFLKEEKWYGMDIFFGYQLYTHQIRVEHIDNPIIHLGLESNTVFFEKALQSVVSRKHFLAEKEGIEAVNPLLKAYKKIKKYHLRLPVALLFFIVKPFLKRNILGSNPKLSYFDWYRLGYICSID